MKIQGPTQSGKTTSAKKAKGAGGAKGAGFAESLKGSDNSVEEASSTQQGGAASAVSSIDLILAVQGVEDATDQQSGAKRRAVEWGSGLLDRLDSIRLGLLAGRIPADRLMRLSEALQREREAIDDPALASVVKDIEVRARVELAKLKHSGR